MRRIPLTQGKVALVSDKDFQRVNQLKWYYAKMHNGREYAVHCAWINGKKKTIYMHRFIKGNSQPSVDHKDNNSLNNQRGNLRCCTRPNNLKNRKVNANNTSGFKGVRRYAYPYSGKPKWVASIASDKIKKTIGYFKTAIEAAVAYDSEATKLHGEFARTNKMEGRL